MSKKKQKLAFIYTLSGSELLSNETGVVQQNAGWALGVIPFMTPDTFRATDKTNQKHVAVRQPFIIENDCISLNITHSKNSPFGSLETVLKAGDINYLSMIFPGDFVFAWMHHDRSKLEPTLKKFLAQQPANDFMSGFKFFGRVESVREHLHVANPQLGIKTLAYTINAASFQEFNTKVYMIPFLTLDSQYNFMQQLINQWYQYIQVSGVTSVQKIVKLFIELFMGTGPTGLKVIDIATPNDAFLLPIEVGKVLGRTRKERPGVLMKYSDVLTMIQGVQNYTSTKESTANAYHGFLPYMIPTESQLSKKLNNPKNNEPVVRHYETGVLCTGENVTYGQKWADVTLWSIISQYANLAVNDLYTCMRVDRDGRIVPTLVMRQIPFTNQELYSRYPGVKYNSTLFMSLPRWRPDPSIVFGHDLGRSNALRVNYVQVWGEMAGGNLPSLSGDYQQMQVFGNREGDPADIKRSGLRSYTLTVPHDFPHSNRATMTQQWTRQIADWTINGHLKLSGSVVMAGITEPICVGDNFEWNNMVFHIEQVNHTAQLAPNGMVSFRTIVALSNGLLATSDKQVEYPYMDIRYRENLADQDRKNDAIYPGYTDIEDIGDRPSGEQTESRNLPSLQTKFTTPKKK